MLHRLREACKDSSGMFSGTITSDESCFGGEANLKHSDKKSKGRTDKTMVQGIKSENQLSFHIIKSAGKKELQGNIREAVKEGSTIMTDNYHGYKGLDKDYIHLTCT